MPEIVPVTAIIPCYQCSKTIARAIESVFRQTNRPVKVIVVDDGSDSAAQITLQHLKNQYGESWLKIIRHAKNAGAPTARNTGWEAATTPYLAFLDADDSWHPRKIEIQYAWMQRHPEVMLTGHPFQVLEAETPPAEVADQHGSRQVKAWHQLLSNRFSTPTVMLKRELPYRFNPNLRYTDDFLMWSEIVLNRHPAWLLENPLAYLYKHAFGAGGLSSQLWNMEKDELHVYQQLHEQQLISFLSKFGLIAFSLAKFVRRWLMVVIGNIGRKSRS